MRKYLFISIIFLQGLTAICQPKNLPTIQDLKQELKSLKGIKYVDKVNQISWTYGIMGRPKFLERADSILKYAKLAFDAASNISYKKGLAEAYLNKASSAKIRTVGLRLSGADETPAIEEGIDYLIPALKLGKELKNNEIIADALWHLHDEFLTKHNLRNKGILELVKKENPFDPIAFYQKAGNEKKLAEAYTYTGEGNFFAGKYEKAFDYTLKAVELNRNMISKSRTKEEHGYRIYLTQQSLSDLANLYKEAGDYQSSLEYLNRSAEIGRKYETGWLMEREKAEIFSLLEQFDSVAVYTNKIRSTSDNAWNNLSLGNALLASNNMDSALYFLLKTHKSFRDIKQMAIFSIPVSLKIAQAYLGKDELKRAKQYATDAMRLAVENNSRPDQMKGYELLSKIHYKLGNSDSAYLNLLQHISLKDSIQNRQFLIRIYGAKKEADIGFLLRDNKLKEAKLKQQNQLKNFLIVGLILLFLIGVFAFRNLHLKRKNEKLRLRKDMELQRLQSEQKQTELQRQGVEMEMQALRAQMNPHFIFNCLSSINRFILKNESKAASKYLTRFSRLMRMVLINSKKPLISLEDELQMLRLYLEMERLRFKNTFSYRISFLNEMEADNLFIPPLLLQPFCENAIWHGLMNKDGEGMLQIDLETMENYLKCTITDNGVGRKKAEELKTKTAEKEKSMGLKITSDRLSLINGENNIQSFFKIEDLTDENDQPAGTKVMFNIRCSETAEIQYEKTA